MKKIIIVLLLTMVVCTMVVGCGDKEPTTSVTTPALAGNSETTTPVTSAPIADPTQTQDPETTPVQPPEEPSVFEISGTLLQIDKINDHSIEYGKMVQRGTVYHTYHGTLEGKVVIEYTMEQDLVMGICNSEGEGTFTGIVHGKEGTFAFIDATSGQFISAYTGNLKGEYTITGGTGELSDLCGVINVTSSFNAASATGTYSGTLGFGEEPEIIATFTPNTGQGSPPTPSPNSLVPSSAIFLWGKHQADQIRLLPDDTFTVSLADYRDNTEFRTWQEEPEIINEGVVELVDFQSDEVDSTLWHTWTFRAASQGTCLLNFKTEHHRVDVKEWTYTVSIDVAPPSAETLSVEFVAVKTGEEFSDEVQDGSVLHRTYHQFFELSGDLEGVFEKVLTWQIDLLTGRSWFIFDGNFTGTVNSKSGTLFFRGYGCGMFVSSGGASEYGFQRQIWVITSGTGELTNLHGNISREVIASPVEPATEPPTYEYTGPFSGTFWFYE